MYICVKDVRDARGILFILFIAFELFDQVQVNVITILKESQRLRIDNLEVVIFFSSLPGLLLRMFLISIVYIGWAFTPTER